MSYDLSHPAQGIARLIIAEMTRAGQLWGLPETDTIRVYCDAVSPEARPTLVLEGSTLYLQCGAASRVVVPARLAVTVQQARGDLRLQNLAGEVSLEVVQGDLRLIGLTGRVVVGQVEGYLHAERVALLQVRGECCGDLRFEEGGTLEATRVAGDLRLFVGREARLGRIQGDLWAEDMEAGLQAERVEGDARLNEIAGPVKLETLMGDLRASGLTGGLSAPRISGDAVVHGPFTAAEGYTLAAEGDVSLHLPADADLRLTVKAAGRIRSDPSLTPATDGSLTFTATLGRGRSRIQVTSNGDLRISQAGAKTASPKGASSDLWDHLSQRIRQQLTASLAAAGIDLETGTVRWGGGGRSREARGRQASSSAAERAQQASAPPPPSLEEEIAVLQMVAAGDITPEEGDRLLQALGV